MLDWTQEDGAGILDHLTDFRLGLAARRGPGDPDEGWWSLLIVLDRSSIDGFARRAAAFADDLLIPVAYGAADRARRPARQHVTIYARRPLVDALNADPNPFRVTAVHLGAEVPRAHLDPDAAAPEPARIDVPQDAVVMAVIDYGIGIAHDLLREGPVRTRVEHAAIMGAKAVPGGGCSVGRTLERGEIDRLLRDWTFADLLDEDGFYGAAGIVDWTEDALSPVALRVSHGTHVAALAAGRAMEAEADGRPIVCAALPSRLVEDTTGLDSLPALNLAIHVLRAQARRFRRPDGTMPPVVFNLSFGNSGGPHDGTGLFAELFESAFGPADGAAGDAPQEAWLTLPAGNLNLGRLHALAGAGRTRLDLAVLPDDRTPSTVQIWMPQDPGAGARVRVRAPSGRAGEIEAVPGQRVSLRDGAGDEVARLACQMEGAPTERRLVTLALAPTARAGGGGQVAPQGDWTIEIERPQDAAGPPVGVWIRRDETLPGLGSGGRQARFEDPRYVRFDRFGAPLPVDPEGTQSPVRRAGTLSGFACGPTPIVVAAYTERDARLSDYSAAGPLAERALAPQVAREGPDLAAKGDESHVRRGVLSAGSRSGSWARLSGTSVAAPRVARAAAGAIDGWAGGARAWSREAVAQDPFDLRGGDDPTRAGAGGIDIPIPHE